ncbi:MAG: hypothetical protein ACP5G8_03500 [Athalassotoga sp.]
MRNDLIVNIKKMITNIFDGQVLTYEPDWTSWASYPVALILPSGESVLNMTGGVSKRELKINVIIVVRSLTTPPSMSDADKYIFDMIDKIEELFRGATLQLSRPVLTSVGSISFDKTFVKGDYYVSGASVELNCQFVR